MNGKVGHAPNRAECIFGTGVCGHTRSGTTSTTVGETTKGRVLYLAFGSVAVETGLSGPVASPASTKNELPPYPEADLEKDKHTSCGDLFPCRGRNP